MSFLVQAEALIGYRERGGKFIEASKEVGAVTNICRKFLKRDDFVELIRVYDIAKLVRKPHLEVFAELTKHYAVPAVPLFRSGKARVWFVPRCRGLENYLAAHGVGEALKRRYLLVDVTNYECCREVLALSVVADSILGLVDFSPLIEALGSLLSRESMWFIRKKIDNFLVLEGLEDLKLRFHRYVRFGRRVFVPFSVLLLHGLVDCPIKLRQALDTILQKGFKAFQSMIGKRTFDAKIVDLDRLSSRFVDLLKRVGESLTRKNDFFHRFYSFADAEFYKACERAIFDKDNASGHYKVALLVARKFNARCYKPKANNFLAIDEILDLELPDSGYKALESQVQGFVKQMEKQFEEAYSEEVGKPKLRIWCRFGSFRIQVPVNIRLPVFRGLTDDERFKLFRLAVEIAGLRGFKALLVGSRELFFSFAFSQSALGRKFLSYLPEPAPS